MDRRTFLAASAATLGSGALAAPALAQGAAARTLRFVPQANLANFDPIWGTQFVVRNASMLVWDTLYGIDSSFTPRRQMVESEEVSQDGLTWTFRLREGLRWHDGEPVRAADCVASLNRWAVRDGMGQMIRAIQQELVAVDDRTFRWVLRQPYPKMLLALGKNNTPIAFMMPERVARTDPFQQITEFVGSGPMRFNRGEWVPGARATWSRFEQYVPRQEPPNWLSGGKRMGVDRIEWIIQPDPATAAAALQQGEVDWWETPLNDLVPTFRRNRQIRVEVADPLGNVGCLRFNHLHAPFNNPRIRQAVAMVISQPDTMRAVIGDDSLWQQMNGFFTPGTPNYTEAGAEILSRPRDAAAARRLLQEAGYNNEPVTMLVAQDIAWLAQMGQVANAALRSIGMNVDFVATDWGTVGARRASREPRERGSRLEHLLHLVRRRRLHQPRQLPGPARPWRGRVVRLALRPGDRGRARQVVRRHQRRGGEGRMRGDQPRRLPEPALRPHRLLPGEPGLPRQRAGGGARAAALVLGRHQVVRSGMIVPGPSDRRRAARPGGVNRPAAPEARK